MFWQERVRKKNKPNEHFGILKDMSLKYGQFSMRDQDVDNLMDKREQVNFSKKINSRTTQQSIEYIEQPVIRKNDLAGLLDVKKTLKIQENEGTLKIDRNYLTNKMMKTTNKQSKKIFNSTVKRRSLFAKSEIEFPSQNLEKPRMRIVINPNGTLTEVDDSLNMIPVQKQQIKMQKHGYADITK